MLIYDVSDLVVCGYLGQDEDPIEQVINLSTNEIHTYGSTVILTEGRSDAWMLKETMALLYPHLAGYFSFMDFAEFRVGGGAGELANLVKSFAAAGIVNRVIAIFDNDAAATVSLNQLKTVKLPKHIVPMQLPDSAALTSYPTLGPSGPSSMDINGLAASIELYLGIDVLRDSHGNLSPIQWTGYQPAIRKYQGELLAKSDVQSRFREKVRTAKADQTLP